MKTIYWIKTANRCELAGRVRIEPPEDQSRWFSVGLSESDLDPVQEWCQQHNCGVRTSFDTFRFRDKKEITMFLLRWS